MAPPFPPIEPPVAHARFPDPDELGEEWVLGVTRSMTPGLVLQAYREGIFPWPSAPGLVPWVSPHPRCVFPLEKAGAWPRTVQRARKAGAAAGWRVTLDEDFEGVMRACSQRPGEGTWITPDLFGCYARLHQLGWAHSLEVWRTLRPGEAESDEERVGGRRLVGGLYGVAVGTLFAGESMFHRETGGSKVAFAEITERARAAGFTLFDVQVRTEHLAMLGCEEISRAEYLRRMRAAVAAPPARL